MLGITGTARCTCTWPPKTCGRLHLCAFPPMPVPCPTAAGLLLQVHAPIEVPAYYEDKYRHTVQDEKRRAFCGHSHSLACMLCCIARSCVCTPTTQALLVWIPPVPATYHLPCACVCIHTFLLYA